MIKEKYKSGRNILETCVHAVKGDEKLGPLIHLCFIECLLWQHPVLLRKADLIR